jgi:hypothetical protein
MDLYIIVFNKTFLARSSRRSSDQRSCPPAETRPGESGLGRQPHPRLNAKSRLRSRLRSTVVVCLVPHPRHECLYCRRDARTNYDSTQTSMEFRPQGQPLHTYGIWCPSRYREVDWYPVPVDRPLGSLQSVCNSSGSHSEPLHHRNAETPRHLVLESDEGQARRPTILRLSAFPGFQSLLGRADCSERRCSVRLRAMNASDSRAECSPICSGAPTRWSLDRAYSRRQRLG